MTMLYVRVRVKFRAFGVTLGTSDRQWRFVYDGEKVSETDAAGTIMPSDARKICDTRGLTVWTW